MRLFFITLFSLLTCVACKDKAGVAKTPPLQPAGGVGHAKFLALGDSYTIGHGVAEADRWPVQLSRLLSSEGLDAGTPRIIAQTGWTTGDLLRAIETKNPAGPFSMVTLLIGVNNQYQGRSEGEYEKQFATLLDKAIALAAGDASRVLVLSIPDWSATPFAQGLGEEVRRRVSGEIDRFNAINRRHAMQKGVGYVDVTPVSRMATQDRGLIADDGLHPSGRMYGRWVELALPDARRIFSPSTQKSGKE